MVGHHLHGLSRPKRPVSRTKLTLCLTGEADFREPQTRFQTAGDLDAKVQKQRPTRAPDGRRFASRRPRRMPPGEFECLLVQSCWPRIGFEAK